MRVRRPTDEQATEVRDAALRDPRLRVAADEVPASPACFESFEGDKTREGLGFAAVAQAARSAGPPPGAPAEAAPTEAAATELERSAPIRVFSMKDHSGPERRPDEQRAPLHVQLRSLAEVAPPRATPAFGLGRLAPPRDPRQARARRVRGNVGWACAAIVLAGAIALAIWFAAGR